MAKISSSPVMAKVVFLCLISGISSFRYKYLGCYIDSDSAGRDIVGKDFTFSSLTLETCIDQCQPAGYPYAGLQFATRCLCGNTYGRIGYSLFCNCTCDGVYCGGYQSNDVFYTVDNSLAPKRGFVYHVDAYSFDEARRICVAASGDLAVVNSQALINDVVSLVSSSNSSSTPSNVWFGLHHRLDSYPYEWTNENTAQYADHITDFGPLWVANDSRLGCVSINVARQKWESKSCTEILPFVCDQMTTVTTPASDGMDMNTNDNAADSNPSADSNRLALYIVVPLFLLCYGGSCILYCAYKIYRNCCQKKRTTMLFEPVPGHPIEPVKMPMGAPQIGTTGVFKRPLSGGLKKSAVFPMSMETLVVKGGAFPKYEPSGPEDVKKTMGQMRKPACIPNVDKLDKQLLPPPPSYFGSHLPGAAPIASPPQPEPPATATPEDNSSMSIHEILKKKIMEKANKDHAK